MLPRQAGIVEAMVVLIGLWLVAAFYEGLLYWQSASYAPNRPLWPSAIILAALLDIAAGLWLVLYSWQAGLLALLLTAYRLLNLARLYKHRLPIYALRTVSLRAHIWLVVAQVASTILVAILLSFHRTSWLIAGFAVVQLLAALVLLRVSVQTWAHMKFSAVEPTLLDRQLPALSVLIPARNETDDLKNCLQSLIRSDYPKLEILVLDDCSNNRRTPEIIRTFAHDGVRFIQGNAPDESRWLAKNHAYEHLAHEASGELLLFAGVDIVFEPQSLRELVQAMHAKQKDMVSIMPLRAASAQASMSLLQPMRYYWEVCLPRRIFKRPPVLSSCWLITAELLEKVGGFEAVARSVTPEAHFARQAVVSDGYSFMRGNSALGIYSSKAASEQYATTIRMRYPQLHRRLELIVLTSLFELVCMLGPFIGFIISLVAGSAAYAFLYAVICFCIAVTYYLVAVATKLNNAALAWLIMPLAFGVDIYMLHVSCFKYEFSSVEWKGRNVCIPVMQLVSELPKI